MAKKNEGKSKYKSKWIVVDGIKFQSIMESEYYLKLKADKEKGSVRYFERQPKYIVQDKFKHPIEGNIRAITYSADFYVEYRDGSKAVIDVKGQATAAGKNARKMFLKKYPYLNLLWITKSKKWGYEGWIDYFELERIRRENRKRRS